MRYFFEKPDIYSSMFGKTYECDHPVYSKCTLYLLNGKGLAVIEQRFDRITKSTYWTEIDPWLVDPLYLNKNFKSYFEKFSGVKTEKGLYPTVTIRQIMYGLKMKPIKRKAWETLFDHTPI